MYCCVGIVLTFLVSRSRMSSILPCRALRAADSTGAPLIANLTRRPVSDSSSFRSSEGIRVGSRRTEGQGSVGRRGSRLRSRPKLPYLLVTLMCLRMSSSSGPDETGNFWLAYFFSPLSRALRDLPDQISGGVALVWRRRYVSRSILASF